MVRPRASERNIQVAMAFADIMTEKMMSPGGSGDVMVSRKGSRSLFQAFCVSVPELVRDAHDKRPKNRQAVSQMEMNKALAASGLKSIRKRDRSTGGTRWCSKVGVFKTSLTYQDWLCSYHFRALYSMRFFFCYKRYLRCLVRQMSQHHVVWWFLNKFITCQ